MSADNGLRRVVAMGGSAGAFPVLLAQARRTKAGDHSCLFLVYHRAGESEFSFAPYVGEKGFRPARARTGILVEADRLYHPRACWDLEVHNGRLRVPQSPERPRPNIDRLFSSLAKTYQARLVGVLLSGYGTDGLRGLRDVRAHGGQTIVQDPRSAAVDVLPTRAIKAGLADAVLPTPKLLDLVDSMLRGSKPPAEPAPASSPAPPTRRVRARAQRT